MLKKCRIIIGSRSRLAIGLFISIFIVASCKRDNFTNPETVLQKFIEYGREGKIDYLYDNYLSADSKGICSKKDYIKSWDYSDSLQKITKYGDLSIKEIPISNTNFKRYKVLSVKTVNSEQTKRLKYYTLKNESGQWKVIDIVGLLEDDSDSFDKKNYPNCIAKLKKCLSIDPYSGIAYDFIGTCYSEDYSIPPDARAKEILENAKLSISLEEEAPAHYIVLSQYYNEINNFDQSIEILKKGMNYCLNEKDKIRFLQPLANLYLTKKDFRTAEIYINQAIQIKNDDGGSWYLLGKIQHSQNDLKSAMESYRKAILYSKHLSQWAKANLFANYAILNNAFQFCDTARCYIVKALNLLPEDKSYQEIYSNIKKCQPSKELNQAIN